MLHVTHVLNTLGAGSLFFPPGRRVWQRESPNSWNWPGEYHVTCDQISYPYTHWPLYHCPRVHECAYIDTRLGARVMVAGRPVASGRGGTCCHRSTIRHHQLSAPPAILRQDRREGHTNHHSSALPRLHHSLRCCNTSVRECEHGSTDRTPVHVQICSLANAQ